MVFHPLCDKVFHRTGHRLQRTADETYEKNGQKYFEAKRLTELDTRCGGASGRAMAFCLSKLGSNPGTDLAFSDVLSIYSR